MIDSESGVGGAQYRPGSAVTIRGWRSGTSIIRPRFGLALPLSTHPSIVSKLLVHDASSGAIIATSVLANDDSLAFKGGTCDREIDESLCGTQILTKALQHGADAVV